MKVIELGEAVEAVKVVGPSKVPWVPDHFVASARLLVFSIAQVHDNNFYGVLWTHIDIVKQDYTVRTLYLHLLSHVGILGAYVFDYSLLFFFF